VLVTGPIPPQYPGDPNGQPDPFASPAGYPPAGQYQQPGPYPAYPPAGQYQQPGPYPAYPPAGQYQQPVQYSPYPVGYPGAQYGYSPYPPTRSTNGLAIASLICSLAAFGCGISAIAGIICGFIARNQIRRSGENGSGMALAGIIVGFAVVALIIIYIVFVVVLIAHGCSQSSDGC
jgi:hypothetical protein